MTSRRRLPQAIVVIALLPILAATSSCGRSSPATETAPPAAASPESDGPAKASSTTVKRAGDSPAVSSVSTPATGPTATPSPLAPPPAATVQPPVPPAGRSPDSLPLAPSAVSVKNRKLRGAVLAASPSGLQTLLEQRLLADARVDWLERAEIDKVLKEQSLQAMFAPEALSSRSSVGRLLGADLLVVTRHVKKEQRETLELIACETSQGLRLCSQSLPVSASNDATVDAALGLVGRAIDKCSGEIGEIWAVPPFVSDNLTNKHDRLKGTYTRLIEQLLLSQRGILVVELAEARSLAKEIELTKGNSPIVRTLPLYVLGRFRNESKEGRDHVTFQLTLARGEQTVRQVPPQSFPAEEVGSRLCRTVAQLCQECRGTPATETNPEIEAKQLAERAATFAQLGQWNEAAALYEASLLLRPRDVATLWEALHAARETFLLARMDMAKDWSDPQRAVAFFQRHQELWRYAVDIVRYHPKLDQHFVAMFFSMNVSEIAVLPPYNIPIADATYQMYADAATFRGDRLVEITRLAVTRQTEPSLKPQFAESMLEIVGRFMTKPAALSWDTQLRALEAIADHPHVVTYARCLTRDAQFELETPATIAKLAASPNPSLRRVADELRKRHGLDRMSPERLEQRQAALRKQRSDAAQGHRRLSGEKITRSVVSWNLVSPDSSSGKPIRIATDEAVVPPRPPALPPEFSSGGVVFRPIWFYRKKFTSVEVMSPIDQIVPVGAGMDIVRQRSSLYLMTQKGRLDLLGECHALSSQALMEITDVQFDGRFVWISTAVGNDNPCLIAYDPQARAAWTISKADGLPFLESTEDAVLGGDRRYVVAAPLAPGKVCVVGSFGRTWIGILHFDPRSGPKFELVYEARTVQERRLTRASKDQWRDPSLGFVPLWMAPLNTASPNASDKGTVLIFRTGQESFVSHPLVLDVAKRDCRLLESGLPRTCVDMCAFGFSYAASRTAFRRRLLHNYAEADGVLYAADPDRGLLRFHPPDFQSEVLVPQPMLGCLVCRNGYFHVAGSKWWSGSIAQRKILVEGETPWNVQPSLNGPSQSNGKPYVHQLFVSEHYGLVALCGKDNDNSLAYQVIVPEKPRGQ